jgi:hypothetical protein
VKDGDLAVEGEHDHPRAIDPEHASLVGVDPQAIANDDNLKVASVEVEGEAHRGGSNPSLPTYSHSPLSLYGWHMEMVQEVTEMTRAKAAKMRRVIATPT